MLPVDRWERPAVGCRGNQRPRFVTAPGCRTLFIKFKGSGPRVNEFQGGDWPFWVQGTRFRACAV